MHVARRRSSARVGGVVCAALILAVACGGGPSEPRPVPSVASSPIAGAAFAEILDAWRDSEHTSPAVLRVLLERFIARFPTDGLTPLVRVYLALVALGTRDFPEADRQLAATETVPPGTTRDLRTVASARRLRLQGNAEAAMDLLRPLVGKAVDPISRALFQEELALAALATQRDYEAISYMDAWLRASTEEDKARTTAAVEALVAQVPKEVLVSALQALRLQRASFGYGVDIERILAARLAAIATETDDAELARLLLDPKAGAIVNAGDAGTELVELATSRRGLNVVAGHTVGLLLPTESPGLRDEAAEVLRGVMWALGLPRGIRTAADATRGPFGRASDAGDALHASEKREPCGSAEPAPALDEPRDAEALRLVTRDDAGSADRTEVSLDELAGEGAALVIGALDALTASRALRWGESHGVPVVALVPPAEGVVAGGFGFVLGEPRESVLDALVRAVPSLTGERAAPILDESQLPFFPPEGGRVGPLTVTPPISCDVPATVAGEPRFPVADFLHDKVHAWLVVGPAACAMNLTAELSAARAQGVVALSLEAASFPAHAAALRVVTVSAGILPRDATGDQDDDELRGFSGRLGVVDWWSALGRDAATLARVALNGLPADVVGEAHAVADRRARARDLLASARVRLWSTEATGWSDTRSMRRTLCAMDVPSSTPPHR
jgi:hypothetical protein